MASPEAILKILVTANSAKANAKLAEMDKTLKEKVQSTRAVKHQRSSRKHRNRALQGIVGNYSARCSEAAAAFERSFAEVRRAVDEEA